MARLRVATCQFAVSGDVERNARAIRRLMLRSRAARADLAHFSEACLSGYPGVDMPSLSGMDWSLHRREMERIMALAAELRLWVVVGSSHALSGGHKPHNSLYVIDHRGALVTRYDKRFCTGGDLVHYSPGDAFTVFDVKGVRCGALICYDFRFQELYREYYRRGVRLMLHSFHNAHGDPRTLPKAGNIHGHIVPATMSAYAANNHMWISANNSQARHSRWPSFFVTPDGMIHARLPLHRTGLAVSEVNTRLAYYDAPGANRDRAVRGILHSGRLVPDPRSSRRRTL
jgi:deaminated glutathione amidase